MAQKKHTMNVKASEICVVRNEIGNANTFEIEIKKQ